MILRRFSVLGADVITPATSAIMHWKIIFLFRLTGRNPIRCCADSAGIFFRMSNMNPEPVPSAGILLIPGAHSTTVFISAGCPAAQDEEMTVLINKYIRGVVSMKNQIHQNILCALFVALTAVCSQIIIPIQPVPITLGTLPAFLSGVILGKKYGALSMVVYILLGAVGVPVFSMGRAGFSVLVSPSGGFIVSWIAVSALIGWICEKYGKKFWTVAGAMAAGNLLCYAVGVSWVIALTGMGVWAALGACMFPFLPGDTAKILLGAFLVHRYGKQIRI